MLGDEGYVSVYWTIDTLDWKTDRTEAQIRSTVLANVQPGAIILMHVGGKATAGVLPTLIGDLRSRGYGFVDLRTALGSGVGRSQSGSSRSGLAGAIGAIRRVRQAYRCSSQGSPSAW